MKKGDIITHRSPISGEEEKGRIVKIEKTPSGDRVIEIRLKNGSTHRDYDTYFK